MFVEYLLERSYQSDKETLLAVAQERYLGQKQPMLRLLLELDVLSRVCSKLDVECHYDNADRVILIPNMLSNTGSEMLVRINNAAAMMNEVLKGMVSSLSSSIANFTNNYVSPVTNKPIKHMADMLLMDTYLRNCMLEEIGVIPYSFYNKPLISHYPDFMQTAKMTVDLHEKHNRGNEAYNSYEDEDFKPLYNDAKIGIESAKVTKNEDLLALDICTRVLDLLGSTTEYFTYEERMNYNSAHHAMRNSPYSACVFLYEIFDVIKSINAYPLEDIIRDTMKFIEENRSLLSLMNAYSKHLTWYSKDIKGSTYGLIHHYLKNQSKLVVEQGHKKLPEDIHFVLDHDGLMDENYILRKNIILTTTYRDDDTVLRAVFKQFDSAIEFYSRVEEWAKEKSNATPIADISINKNLPLFHNPNLDTDLDFRKYRASLVSG